MLNMTGKYKKSKINGKLIDTHRKIMQEKLHRTLTRHEVVHHINGIRSDNRIENLEVMSLSEHSRLHMKNVYIGENNNSAVLTEYDVVDIKRRLAEGMSAYKISKLYPVHHKTIWDIQKGYTWKHV